MYLLCLIVERLALYQGVFSLCHPDNSSEVNRSVTPAHIVPEWYYLIFYGILKCIPSKLFG